MKALSKMTKPNVTIRYATPDDHARWREMWEDYLVFYNEPLRPEVSDETWRRFFDDSCQMYCLVAADENGKLIGFAAHVLHPGTWGKGDICYLEDLYVAPEARCMGVARKLIAELIETGKQKNWFRVYWHTDDGNHTARALYDKVGTLTDRVKYEVKF